MRINNSKQIISIIFLVASIPYAHTMQRRTVSIDNERKIEKYKNKENPLIAMMEYGDESSLTLCLKNTENKNFKPFCTEEKVTEALFHATNQKKLNPTNVIFINLAEVFDNDTEGWWGRWWNRIKLIAKWKVIFFFFTTPEDSLLSAIGKNDAQGTLSRLEDIYKKKRVDTDSTSFNANNRGQWLDEIRVRDKMTPLMVACDNGNETVICLLIAAGSSLEATDKYGRTPLVYAADKRNEDIAMLIVQEKPATASFACTYYEKVRNWVTAKSKNILKVGQTIFSGKSENSEVSQGTENNSASETNQTILDSNTNISENLNGKDTEGNTKIHIAVFQKNINFLKSLSNIQEPIPVNEKNNAGQTPLHLAVLCGDENITRLLVNSGASVDTQNNDGLTPVDLAAKNEKGAILIYFIQKTPAFKGEIGKSVLEHINNI